MAVLIQRAITRLLPSGIQAKPTGLFSALIEALSESIDRARVFLGDVRLEALPATADDTLDAWSDMLGVKFYEDMNTQSRQSAAVTALTATGGSSLSYLTAQIQKKFPQVYVEETDDLNFYLRGSVITASDLIRLYALVSRIAPLHLVPNYSINIIAETDTAYCGISICGRAVTGRIN